jgi:DNA-binding transcriptional ArsR family regulator
MKPYLSQEVQISAEHQASFFRVLGNPQRVLILWLIAERARTATEIALAVEASLTSTGHHLRILEFNQLVEIQREYNNSIATLPTMKSPEVVWFSSPNPRKC